MIYPATPDSWAHREGRAMDGEHERERRETEACLAGIEAAIDRMDPERVNATLDAVTRPLTENMGTREMLRAVAQALLEGVAPFKA